MFRSGTLTLFFNYFGGHMFSNIFKTRAPATKIISLQDQLVIARDEARKQFQRANAAEIDCGRAALQIALLHAELATAMFRGPDGRMQKRVAK